MSSVLTILKTIKLEGCKVFDEFKILLKFSLKYIYICNTYSYKYSYKLLYNNINCK